VLAAACTISAFLAQETNNTNENKSLQRIIYIFFEKQA
jgi:hypothetical protein